MALNADFNAQAELKRADDRVAAATKLRDMERTDFLDYAHLEEHADKIAALGAFVLLLTTTALFFSYSRSTFEVIKKLKRPRWAPKYGMGYFGIYLLRTLFNLSSFAVVILKEGDIDIWLAVTFGLNATFQLIYTLSIVTLGDVSLAMLMMMLGFLTTIYEALLLSQQSNLASKLCFGGLALTIYQLLIVGRMFYKTEFQDALQMMEENGFKGVAALAKMKTNQSESGSGGGGGGGRKAHGAGAAHPTARLGGPKKKVAKIPTKDMLESLKKQNSGGH